MPRNPYYNFYQDTNMQQLYKQLIDQCVQMFGISCSYIPRISLSSPDLLFGDDPTKAFGKAYPVTLMIMNIDSFDGPGDMMAKFGWVIQKEIRLLMGNTDFQTSTSGNIGTRPREGDLIYLSPFQALYEINHVNQDKFFYTFGNQQFYGWELSCEEFKYNSEDISSGVPEIDTKLDSIAIAYQASMNSNGWLTFMEGEDVYQGNTFANSNATALVVSWNKPTGNLVLRNISGKFYPNTMTYGVQSGAQYQMISIEIQDNINDGAENNILIRTEANTDLDLSENNTLQGNPITYSGQE